MNNRHQEKLSLIQDLIALSEADGIKTAMEEDFIQTVVTSFGITEEEVEHLKNNPIAYSPEDKETDRIIQFYRLLLLLGVDPEKTTEEINCCKEIALKMGLNPIAVNKTIEQILSSETGTLTPETVIRIFQVQHN